jgi:hypothetical protein
MKFSFKTLEKQLEEGGFVLIGKEIKYEWQPETFSDTTMEYIGKIIERSQRMKKFEFDQVFLRIRPMMDGEQAGRSNYREQKVIEIYAPK